MPLPTNTKPWLGTWTSTDRTENWEAFVKALGPNIPTHFVGKHHKSIHKFTKPNGDAADNKFRHEVMVLPEDIGFKRVLEFKMGEEVKFTKDGIDMLFKYTEDSEGTLKVEIRVPAKNKVIHDIFRVTGDNEIEKVLC
nr:SAHS [Hypsibius exemplaris]